MFAAPPQSQPVGALPLLQGGLRGSREVSISSNLRYDNNSSKAAEPHIKSAYLIRTLFLSSPVVERGN